MHFVYPTFLWALLSLAIPVIIHLFNFRRYKTVYFTNVKFLKEVKQETTTRSQLKHLLVLLARLLALTAVVLAFAQPYIPAEETVVTKGPNAVSIYLDNSFSMGALSEDLPLLEKAKQKAREIIESYGAADRFQLLTNDIDAIHQRMLGRETIGNELDQLGLSPRVADISTMLAIQKQVLNRSEYLQKDIYVLSDFQKSTANLDLLAQDSAFNIYFIPVSSVSRKNVFIDTCWLTAPVSMIQQVNHLVFRLTNTGEEAIENSRITLKLNGQTKAINDFNIAANASITDTVSFSLTQPGSYEAELSIVDYPVSFDDNLWFSFEVKPNMPVLILNEEKENKYLQAIFSNPKYFELTSSFVNQLDYSSLPEFQLIILNELKSMPSGLNTTLREFIAKGGSVLLFSNPLMDINSFNVLMNSLEANPFLGINDGEQVMSGINYEEEVFKDVFEELPDNIGLPRVKMSFTFAEKSTSREERLLTFKDKSPFLSKYIHGAGKFYVVAAPLDIDYTDLPVHSIFVPMIYRIAWLSQKPMPLYYTIGSREKITVETRDFQQEKVFKLKKEDFEFIPEQRMKGAIMHFNVIEQLRSSGVYELFRDAGQTEALLSFNYDRKESLLDCYTGEDLTDAVSGLNIRIIDTMKGSLTTVVKGIHEGVVLWKLCLIFALLFLACEIFLLRSPVFAS